MKKLRVTIEGKAYDVLVEVLEDSGGASPPAPASLAATAASAGPPKSAPSAAPSLAPASPKSPAASGGEVPCPLTGKIVSIDVKVGDAVQEGAQVATVEAMKMNTYIYAPRSGRVAAILVSPGQGVEEGTALLSIA